MLRSVTIAALLFTALPAMSAAQEVQSNIRVTYRDLDLRRAADVEIFDRRLRNAIAAACPDDGHVDLEAQAEIRNCRIAKRAEVLGARNAAVARAQRTEIVLAR